MTSAARDGPGRDNPAGAEPARAEPARAEPARAASARAASARAAPARAAPARAAPARAAPARAAPVRLGPADAPTLAEICVVACAQAWRGDGAILASPMGLIPTLGARLARLTFVPELLLTDGEATLLVPDEAHGSDGMDGADATGKVADVDRTCRAAGASAEWTTEGWLPYRDVFRLLAAGRRHVMMGAAQLDRYGNQNISCIGDWAHPKAQLLGVRGAPGNTINHPVSYWIPRHSARVLVERVDMVSGIGYDRAAGMAGVGTGGQAASRARAGVGAAFHEIRLVVTDKAVLDFRTPDHSMRVRSVHPGVGVEQVQALTGFPLAIADDLAVTPLPTPAELALIRERLDPAGLRDRELA